MTWLFFILAIYAPVVIGFVVLDRLEKSGTKALESIRRVKDCQEYECAVDRAALCLHGINERMGGPFIPPTAIGWIAADIAAAVLCEEPQNLPNE